VVTSNDFYERFNRLIGRRTGRPWNRPRQSTLRQTSGDYQASRVRTISRGSPSVRSSTTRAYNKKIGRGPGSRGRAAYTRSNAENIWNNTYNDLVERFNTTAAESAAIERANQEAMEANGDRSWWQDIWHAVGGYDLGDAPIARSPFSEDFGNSLLGRGLNLLGRPAFALAEGLQTIAEHEDQGYSPGNIADIFGEFGGGLWRGFSGQETTGFGDVYEALKENENTGTIGGFLREFEQQFPDVEQRFAQGVGLAGELFLDPLNKLGVAAPRVVRGATRSADELLTEATARQVARNAGEEAVNDFITNSPLATNRSLYQNNPGHLVSRVTGKMDELINNSIADVLGGGSRGTRLMNDQTWPSLVAAQATGEIQKAMTETFTQKFDNLYSKFSQRKLDVSVDASAITVYRRMSKDFDHFWRQIEDDMVSSGYIHAGATVDEVLTRMNAGGVPNSIWNNAYKNTIARYDPELQPIYDRIHQQAENFSYRTLGLRVGKRVIPAKAVGRAYHWATDPILNKVFPNRAHQFQDMFFEKRFSGIFGGKTARARAVGFNAVDDFRKAVQDFARKYTPDQARELHYALEAGIRPLDSHLAAGYDWIRNWYNNIFNDEVIMGARPTGLKRPGQVRSKPFGSAKGDEYYYIFFRKGREDVRQTFKRERKSAWNEDDNVVPRYGQWDTAKAKSMGLDPVEHAFENLFMRYVKSRRDIVRSHFYNDLVENYAIGHKPLRHVTKRARGQGSDYVRGLTKVDTNRLKHSLRMSIEKEDGDFFIPSEIAKLDDVFYDMTSWSTANWNKFWRGYSRAINGLKFGLTIPYPGFHIRNMIGDVFMGLLDNINPRAYGETARRYAMYKAGKTSTYRIIEGQLELTFRQMLDLYHRNADAGFFSTEFGTYNSITAGAIPRRFGRRVANTVREASDMREQMGRFVQT
jgi:hypothetical protein